MAQTPLYFSVLNENQTWNAKSEKNVFYSSEISYVIEMIKNSERDFDLSEMVNPFYFKAKTTLLALTNEFSHPDIVSQFIEINRECSLKNTLRLLARCKQEFYTRETLIEIF